GAGDQDMIETAKAILSRGDPLVMFPEGTRTRPGSLGHPKRGVGRLALETGAPVVPVAVIGTEAVRKGWRIRPHKVRIRVGRALRFPRVDEPSPQLAQAVTERIWPCVMLQWEWLGGLPPLRRAVVVGAGSCGISLASMLARGGLEVELGCRTADQALALGATRSDERYLPGVVLPDGIAVRTAADLDFASADLVCFAVPAPGLPAALAEHGARVPDRAGALVAAKGVVPPTGALPTAYVAERGRWPRWAAPRWPPTRSCTVPRWCWRPTTRRSPASSTTSCAPPATTAIAPATCPASTSQGRPRTPLRWRRPPPARAADPTPRAPRPARCSRRSRRSRRSRAGGPRPSPAWPAPATSSPPPWPSRAATAAPASCSA